MHLLVKGRKFGLGKPSNICKAILWTSAVPSPINKNLIHDLLLSVNFKLELYFDSPQIEVIGYPGEVTKIVGSVWHGLFCWRKEGNVLQKVNCEYEHLVSGQALSWENKHQFKLKTI